MRNGEPGWFASLLGAAVLIAGGFALGLVAGVVSEEPDLVVGHLVGRSDEVAWSPEGEPEFTESRAQARAAAPGEPLELAALPDSQALEELPGFEEPHWREGAELGTDPETLEALPDIDAPVLASSLALDGETAPAPVASELPAVAAAPPARRDTRGARDVSSLPSLGTSSPARAVRSGFAVQVGAFAERDAADSVRTKLLDKGFDSYLVPSSGDGKWRVRVGPVPTRGSAELLASRLKAEERLPTWVLSEGGG